MKIDIRKIPSYVINVEKDIKRYNTSSTLLKFLQFENFQYVKGVEEYKGCEKSHYQIMSDSSIPTPYIIFEDDIILNSIPNFIIDIPDDADALYLGASEWGTFLNRASGRIVHYDKVDDRIVRVYNMLGTHAILYLNEEYRSAAKRVIHYHSKVSSPITTGLDCGLAEIQKYYNVYALDTPLFKQSGYNETPTSSKISKVGISREEGPGFFDTHNKTPSKLLNIPDSSGFTGGSISIPFHQQNAKT